MAVLLKFIERTIAYGLILVIILYPKSREDAVSVNFKNLEKEDVYLCWMSAYERENEIISNSRDKCWKIVVSDSLKMNTFAGHRFLALSSSKLPQVNSYQTQYFSVDPTILQYNISFATSNSLSAISNSNFTLFYLWNNLLLRFRHEVMVILTLLLIAWENLFPIIIPKDGMKSIDSTSRQLLLPRQVLKAFATLMMLLNHASYLFLRDSPSWRRLGALPADLAGSLHLYSWLTGYNYSPHSRSKSWIILLAYLLLEQYCRLPSPFAYETLMTIVVARKLLSFSYFESFLLNSSLLFHSIFLSLLLLSEPLLNADGLRILQITGLIYAIAGRMFVLPVDIWKQLIWLFAGAFKIICLMWTVTIKEIDTSSPLQIAVTMLCLLWFCFHIFLLGCPVKKPLWNYSPNFLITLLSRYSLEIYVLHLFLAYYYELQTTTTTTTNNNNKIN